MKHVTICSRVNESYIFHLLTARFFIKELSIRYFFGTFYHLLFLQSVW